MTLQQSFLCLQSKHPKFTTFRVLDIKINSTGRNRFRPANIFAPGRGGQAPPAGINSFILQFHSTSRISSIPLVLLISKLLCPCYKTGLKVEAASRPGAPSPRGAGSAANTRRQKSWIPAAAHRRSRPPPTRVALAPLHLRPGPGLRPRPAEMKRRALPPAGAKERRWPPPSNSYHNNFINSFTLSSKYFSSFVHTTCLLLVSQIIFSFCRNLPTKCLNYTIK